MGESRNHGRRVGAALLLAVALCTGLAATGKVKGRGLVLPIYLGQVARPIAVVRVAELSEEYGRRGFFRIGVLPMLVATGVAFEFRDLQQVHTALGQVPNRLRSGPSQVLELRDVRMEFGDLAEGTAGSGSTNTSSAMPRRIHAARVRVGEKEWKLSGGIQVWVRTNEYTAAEGRLLVAGEQRGQLRLKGSVPELVFQLAPTPSPRP